MAGINSLLPAGKWFREAWEFNNEFSSSIRSIVPNGNYLGLQNSTKRRTICNGVRFTGDVTSEINCGALYNASVNFWMSFRVKLDVDYGPGSVEQTVFHKYLDATHFVQVSFSTTTGCLIVMFKDGATTSYNLSAATTFEGNVWHHILFSMSAASGLRFFIDGVLATDPTVCVLPNGGNMILGNHAVLGGLGFRGVMSDVVAGNDVLSSDEEQDLILGVPPADAVSLYSLNEGRGDTIYDRGSALSNGTLGALASWDFDSKKTNCLSGDGLNDYVEGNAANLVGQWSIIWVAKIKTVYSGISRYRYPLHFRVSGDWNASIFGNVNGLYAQVIVDAVGKTIKLPTTTINEYRIVTMTFNESYFIAYSNGILIEQQAAAYNFPASIGSVYLCGLSWGDTADGSESIFVGLVNGALSPNEVKSVSRSIDQRYNLGIGI